MDNDPVYFSLDPHKVARVLLYLTISNVGLWICVLTLVIQMEMLS